MIARRTAAAALAALALAGCSSGPTGQGPGTPSPTPPAAGAAPGGVVAVPADGVAPDRAMDVGGPGLTAMCAEGRQPLPVDMVYASCDTVPEGGEGAAGGTARGLALDAGTYWVVIVCDGAAELDVTLEAEGLAPSTSVACDPSGRAVRQRIGVLAEAATTDLVSHVTGTGVTVASWLVREGKAEL